MTDTGLSDFDSGWLDETMDASAWWQAESISPVNAAMLLAGSNPNKETIEDCAASTSVAENCITSKSVEMKPNDFQSLKNIFEGASKDKSRTLKDWAEYAHQRKLKVHPWLKNWILAMGGEPATPLEAAIQHVKPVPRLAAQETLILESIHTRNLDPLALPKLDAGKRSVKADIRDDLTNNRKDVFVSKKVFNDAWQGLRDAKRIVNK